KHHHGHQFFLVLAHVQRQKPAMFAQMPLFVYRHFTGAACTTSSDGRFASFSLASWPSNSSDMVRSRTSRSAVACSARPIQNVLPGITVAIVEVIWRMAAPGRRLEPNARLCVAFAQVAKVKAGFVAIKVKENRRLQLQAFQSVSLQAPLRRGLFFGAL